MKPTVISTGNFIRISSFNLARNLKEAKISFIQLNIKNDQSCSYITKHNKTVNL